MTKVTFRPAVTDEDYEACARISTEQDPDSPVTAAVLRKHDLLSPEGTPKHRELMEQDGRPVGHVRTIQVFWGDSPTLFDVRFLCSPQDEAWFETGHRRATELAVSDGATDITTWSDERHPARMRWLAEQGFVEKQRNPVSFLDLTSFEPQQWSARVQQGFSGGIEAKSCESLIQEGGADAFQRLWELEDALMADVPLPYEWKGIPFEEFKRFLESHERHWPTLWIALDQGEYVGQTQLMRNEADPSLAETGLTGVVRSHRRRGIAAALKIKSLAQAKELGVRRLGTDNEQNNPMYGLNVALGFRKEYEAVGFERPV
ncbi:MAG: GNAT family N-acetyltransferase [Fimbriimonadaceae bacterium]